MHGPEVFALETTVDRAHLKEVLRAILHTILFHRVFSLVTPLELDTLGITYPSVDDSEISRQVEEKVRALTASADAMAPPTADTQRYRTPAHSRAPSSSTLSSTAISSLSIGSSPQHVQKLAQGGGGGSPLTGHTHPPTRLQLAVLFFEKRPRKAWFGKTDADVCWEQWVLTTTVTWPQTDRERSQERAVSSAQLRRVLGEIIARCEEHREHVPIITTSEVNPFPFQISIPSGGDSWGSMIKRMLVDATPPILS